MAQTSLGANVFRRAKREFRQGSFGGEDASPGVLKVKKMPHRGYYRKGSGGGALVAP